MHPSRSPILTTLSLLLPLLPSVAAQSSEVPNGDCNCYRTGQSNAEALTFMHYQFHDFRSIPSEDGNDYTQEPADITAEQDSGGEEPTAEYFSNSDFSNDWVIQNWRRDAAEGAPIPIQNSAGNIFISREDTSSTSSPTILSLRTSRLPTFQSTAELVTANEDLMYASIRVRARVSGDAGAVAGMFLYFNAANESDVEILTRDPPEIVRLTNQPGLDEDGNVVPEASSEAGIPTGGEGGDSSNSTRGEWNTYRLDWRPELSEWIVNNVSLASKSYGVPTQPSHFHLNMWSNGGQWSENMTDGGTARMDVQWVEMVYNVSGEDGADSACTTVCGTDGQADLAAARVAVQDEEADEGEEGSAVRLLGGMGALGWICLVAGAALAGGWWR